MSIMARLKGLSRILSMAGMNSIRLSLLPIQTATQPPR
jgi:hypothetical protein